MLCVVVMAGLVPAIHVLLKCMNVRRLDFVTNKRDGILYAGVISDLPQRAFQHREGQVKGFTRQYGLKLLVYYEQFDDIRDAIQRESTIKHWPRAWKVRLIHGMNPEWDDLYDRLI